MTNANLKKIAELSKCSISTVSRALNDSPLISAETIERVKKVAQKLDYHPNTAAKALHSRKTSNLGVILFRNAMQSFENLFFVDLFTSINQVANQSGYFTLNCYYDLADQELDFEYAVRSLIKSNRIDGALVLASIHQNAHIQIFSDNQFPFMVLGKPMLDTNNWIDNNNVAASRDLTQYVLERGYTRPVFISGPSYYSVCYDRFRGFLDACQAVQEASGLVEKMNLGIDQFMALEADDDSQTQAPVFFTTFDLEGAQRAGEFVIANRDRFDAVIATDDFMGFIILNLLKETPIAVPEEIGLAAFNNSYFSKLSLPPITTVETFPAQLGEHLTSHLIQMLANKSHSILNHIVPTEIVVGATTR